MNHTTLRLLVSASIDDALTLDERRSVERHLGECSECRRFVDEVQQSRRLILGLGNIDLRPSFASEVANAAREVDSESVTWETVEHYARGSFAALVFAVMLLALLTSFVQPGTPQPVEQYIAGEPIDSLGSHILFKQGDLSKGDVLFAVVSR